MSLIGIDLGTSFIKAGILDMDTLQLKHVQRVPFPDPLPVTAPLFREFDPRAVLAAVWTVLGAIAPHADNCQGIVICTQMHGIVFTTEDGQPFSNLTTWQDQRVVMQHPSGQGTYFDVMKARLTAEEIRQLGNELRPGLPVGLFFWMAEQGLLPSQHSIPAALSDFVIAHLCGTYPTTDTTNAAAHGLLNLETLDWHHEVITKLGLNSLKLPEICAHGTVVGWLELGGKQVPCYTPIGDYQCAILGALLQSDELSLNISTGSQVSLLKSNVEYGNFQTRPFLDNRFSITITHIPAGRALNALVRLLSELAVSQGINLPDPWAYITQMASRVSTSTMRANLAFYSSASGDEGELTHLREEELTIGHLFRAAFESMADSYYFFAQRLSPEKAWSNLVFSGGLVQKIDLLRQIICGKFYLQYRVSPAQEDTLLGLMALGLAFTGRTATVTEATTLLSNIYNAKVPV